MIADEKEVVLVTSTRNSLVFISGLIAGLSNEQRRTLFDNLRIVYCSVCWRERGKGESWCQCLEDN